MNGSESPWPTRVTRIRAKVRKMICGRALTLSGTASAAARETAPRIPLQPTAKRWPAVSPASRAHREDEGEPDARSRRRRSPTTGQSSSLTPEEVSLSVSTISGQLQAEQDEEGDLEAEDEHAPEGDGAEADVGVERARRLVAAVDAGDDGGEDAGDVQLLGADVGAVGGQDREEDRERRRRSGGGSTRSETTPTASPTAMPPSGDADEFERRAAEAEGAAGRDPDGDPVEDQGGAVVDHRLAFDQQPHPLRGAEAAEDRGRGDGVGGGEDGAEDRRLGPAQPGHQGVGDERDRPPR